jgi:hypothetical protein
MTAVWYGPAAWEDPAPARYGPVALAAGPAAGDPASGKIADLLLSPPSPAEIITETEQLVFAD